MYNTVVCRTLLSLQLPHISRARPFSSPVPNTPKLCSYSTVTPSPCLRQSAFCLCVSTCSGYSIYVDSGFLHLAFCFWGSYCCNMYQSVLHSFLWLDDFLLYVCTTLGLSLHPLVDAWDVPPFGYCELRCCEYLYTDICEYLYTDICLRTDFQLLGVYT